MGEFVTPENVQLYIKEEVTAERCANYDFLFQDSGEDCYKRNGEFRSMAVGNGFDNPQSAKTVNDLQALKAMTFYYDLGDGKIEADFFVPSKNFENGDENRPQQRLRRGRAQHAIRWRRQDDRVPVPAAAVAATAAVAAAAAPAAARRPPASPAAATRPSVRQMTAAVDGADGGDGKQRLSTSGRTYLNTERRSENGNSENGLWARRMAMPCITAAGADATCCSQRRAPRGPRATAAPRYSDCELGSDRRRLRSVRARARRTATSARTSCGDPEEPREVSDFAKRCDEPGGERATPRSNYCAPTNAGKIDGNDEARRPEEGATCCSTPRARLLDRLPTPSAYLARARRGHRHGDFLQLIQKNPEKCESSKNFACRARRRRLRVRTPARTPRLQSTRRAPPPARPAAPSTLPPSRRLRVCDARARHRQVATELLARRSRRTASEKQQREQLKNSRGRRCCVRRAPRLVQSSARAPQRR